MVWRGNLAKVGEAVKPLATVVLCKLSCVREVVQRDSNGSYLVLIKVQSIPLPQPVVPKAVFKRDDNQSVRVLEVCELRNG